jgi:hypothetical protein
MHGRFKILAASLSLIIMNFSVPAAAGALQNLSLDSATLSAYSDDGTTKTIFGGYAGAFGTCVGAVSTSLCNSCSDMSTFGGLTRSACNARSVHGSLVLKISFSTSETIAAGAQLIAKFGENSVAMSGGQSTTLAPNTTLLATITWDTICQVAKSLPCATAGNFTGQFTVGISDGPSSTTFAHSQAFTFVFESATTTGTYVASCENTTLSDAGFCYLEGYPGDEKVYFEGIKRAGITHDGTAKYKALRIYYIEGNNNFSSIPISTAPYQDLQIQDVTKADSSLSLNSVTGLTNDVIYSFAYASVDQAENVLDFSNPSNLSAAKHSITPQKVVGLLENKKCFIATAAYGSPWDKNVNTLRSFKNKVLLRSKWGEQFVDFYYKHSPAIAHIIEQNEILKASVRILLTPWVWLATVANEIADSSQP